MDFTFCVPPAAASDGSGQADVAKGLREPDRLRLKRLASIEGLNQSLKQQARAGRNALCDSISIGPALEKRPMAKPKVPKQADDKDQSERCIETTRKVEADDAGKALNEAFKKTVPTAKPKVGWRMLCLPDRVPYV